MNGRLDITPVTKDQVTEKDNQLLFKVLCKVLERHFDGRGVWDFEMKIRQRKKP